MGIYISSKKPKGKGKKKGKKKNAIAKREQRGVLSKTAEVAAWGAASAVLGAGHGMIKEAVGDNAAGIYRGAVLLAGLAGAIFVDETENPILAQASFGALSAATALEGSERGAQLMRRWKEHQAKKKEDAKQAESVKNEEFMAEMIRRMDQMSLVQREQQARTEEHAELIRQQFIADSQPVTDAETSGTQRRVHRARVSVPVPVGAH